MAEWSRFWIGLYNGTLISLFIFFILFLIAFAVSVRGEDALAVQMPSNNSYLNNVSSFKYDVSNPVPSNLSPSYFYIEAIFLNDSGEPLVNRSVNVSMIGSGSPIYYSNDGTLRPFYDNETTSGFQETGSTDSNGYFFMIVPDFAEYYIQVDTSDYVFGWVFTPYIYFDTTPSSPLSGSAWIVGQTKEALNDINDLRSAFFNSFGKIIFAIGGLATIIVIGLLIVLVVGIIKRR